MKHPVAVIDTNVIVAMYTVADITGSIERREPPEKQHWRLLRAREALRLAILLHERGAVTFSLHNEPLEMIQKLVPQVPNVTFAYTELFVRFVYPNLLSGWRSIGDPRLRVTGNRADDELLRLARERNVPLITFGSSDKSVGDPRRLG